MKKIEAKIWGNFKLSSWESKGPTPARIPPKEKQEIARLVVWLFLGGFRWHWDGALVTFHSTGWVDRDPYAGLLESLYHWTSLGRISTPLLKQATRGASSYHEVRDSQIQYPPLIRLFYIPIIRIISIKGLDVTS